MRPVVKTALRRLWRDSTTVQIGVHPERALVLGGLGRRTSQLLAAVDGTRNEAELRATARQLGLDADVADRLIGLLVDASVVDDTETDPGPLRGLSPAERDRIAPELASLSITSGHADGGVSAMRRRVQAIVRVIGAGRVGSTIASLLAAAGVGHIVVDDGHPCESADCAPAGASMFDTGATRAQATRAAIHRVSESVQTTALRSGDRVDLAVLAPSGTPPPSVPEELLRSGTPHLLAVVRETTGIVGPFVVPGMSACLRCLDLHRADRDPAWPLVAAQLAGERDRSSTSACDISLATLVASVATLQVLAAIDGDERDRRWNPAARWGQLPTRDGTLELTLPDWRLRRRRWSAHPACGCQWPQAAPSTEPADFSRSERLVPDSPSHP